MIVECKGCEAVVDAIELNSYDHWNGDDPPAKWTFLRCPKCSGAMLAVQEDYGEGWDDPVRVFPTRDKAINPRFPKSIRLSYAEALACYKSKAFTASAIMCRKTLEGICSVHGVKARNLAASLKEMKEKGIIEKRLFDWAEALRDVGNQAAHDIDSQVPQQESRDILDFTDALLEYVFTFRDKFDEFNKRREKAKKAKAEADDGTVEAKD